MIDAVNAVNVVYRRYWDNKTRVCWQLSKIGEKPVKKTKEKIKKKVGGVVLQTPQLMDLTCNIDLKFGTTVQTHMQS